MSRYSLVAINIIDKKQEILIPKKSLIEIDKFIYEKFNDLDSVCKYFNVPINSKLYISYKYNNVTKYLDLIFKNNKFNISNILNTSNGSNIDERNNEFINIINEFMSVFTIEELDYLYKSGYINRKIYEDLYIYKSLDTSNYQNMSDRNDIMFSVRHKLQSYLNFRRLIVGIYKCRNNNSKNDNEEYIQNKISTEDELLNILFNNGDMDSVYSNYDLDDLLAIDGYEQIPIDGLKRK